MALAKFQRAGSRQQGRGRAVDRSRQYGDKLQALRTALDKPLLITSAYRSAAHNKRVGGATHSQHRLGKAFDIRMENQNPAAFEKAGHGGRSVTGRG